MTIKQFEKLLMEQAAKKGFGTTKDEIDVAEKIALIHNAVFGWNENLIHNFKKHLF